MPLSPDFASSVARILLERDAGFQSRGRSPQVPCRQNHGDVHLPEEGGLSLVIDDTMNKLQAIVANIPMEA